LEYYKRNGVIVRDSVLEDVELLVKDMRQADIAEGLACGADPYNSVQQSYEQSTLSLTAEFNGKIICMTGIVDNPNPESLLGRISVIWVLSAKELENHKITFGIISKKFLKVLLDYRPVIQNFVDARYIISVNWIKWLGGELGPALPIGVHGELFRHFIFRK
jgi:hypothetical protein